MHGGSTIPGGSTPSSVVDLDYFCFNLKVTLAGFFSVAWGPRQQTEQLKEKLAKAQKGCDFR